MRNKRVNRVCVAVLAVALGALAGAGTAGAAPITIGSSLQGEFNWPTMIGSTGTYISVRLAKGAKLLSPVDGAVIGWKVSEGFEGGRFRLQVVDPGVPNYFAGGATSAPVSPGGMPGRFATNLPIKKGEGVGLVAEGGAMLGVRLEPSGGGEYMTFVPTLGNTQTLGTTNPIGEELGYNAEILPAPTVTALVATTGPAAGGTKVTITGTDFTKVSGVKFGASAAASYKVESAGKIVATAPAGSAGKAVTVSVTTVAGTASAAGKFVYATKTAVKTAKGKNAKKS